MLVAFALLGALMGIYVAAALQNGPDVADANLCKLARRFSNSVPDQCIPSLDDYGTAVAAIFCVACLVLLLWDFKAPVYARCLQAVGWGRPRVRKAAARVEPHLILTGFFVTLIGLAIIGYGIWKKPQAISMAQAESAPQVRADNRPSMLTGRPVSGLEVATRLEKLENEHASTVEELKTVRKQLTEKERQLATRSDTIPNIPQTNSNATLSQTKKFYSQRNKNELADALTDLSVILNTNADDIVKRAAAIIRTWDRQGQQKLDAAALIDQLNALSNATSIFYRSLYDDGAFLGKYKTFSDEMKSVLKLPENSPNYDPIAILQVSINGFSRGISTIQLAQKYNDERLTANMVQNMLPALLTLQKGDDTFRAWLDETRKRIDAFRNSLG